MSKPVSASGRQLYALLPEVYRSRDNGDLALYLDACGELLDRVRQTLEQRLADCFPDNPPEGGLACQPWLIPYFAELFDVRLVSPEDEGKRDEIANAVSWRQRKGTLACIEEIAQGVGQFEVEIQEGRMRVATTARVDAPLMPFSLYGEKGDGPNMTIPSQAATHPALPAATVDFRLASQAVKTDENNPAARRLRFDGGAAPWRQDNPHGVPCFGGSYEDASRRTADMRTPTTAKGHAHPRHLLLFTKPYAGFFPEEQHVDVSWTKLTGKAGWRQVDAPSKSIWEFYIAGEALVRREKRADTNRTCYTNISAKGVRILDAVINAPKETREFDGFVFGGGVLLEKGTIRIRRCAVDRLEVNADSLAALAVDAVDCLFDTIDAGKAWCRFEYCTVRTSTTFGLIQASDSIFDGDLFLEKGKVPEKGNPVSNCIRYSCLPPMLCGDAERALHLDIAVGNTREQPVYDPVNASVFETQQWRVAAFGERGCGVLHPSAPASIRSGAEDGGEMGAYHHRYYCQRQEALLEKLKDFLPLGLEAVLIPDVRLLVEPGKPDDTPVSPQKLLPALENSGEQAEQQLNNAPTETSRVATRLARDVVGA